MITVLEQPPLLAESMALQKMQLTPLAQAQTLYQEHSPLNVEIVSLRLG